MLAARFELEEVLGPGEVVALPTFVPHRFKALERTLAIDLFSPVSDRTGIERGEPPLVSPTRVRALGSCTATLGEYVCTRPIRSGPVGPVWHLPQGRGLRQPNSSSHRTLPPGNRRPESWAMSDT